MLKPVEQHYIPKAYLRHFQIDNDKNKSFVYCIDFSNQYKKGVQRLGINDKVFKFPKYYNDNRLEDPFALEKVFAKEVEPYYDKIIKALSICLTSRGSAVRSRQLPQRPGPERPGLFAYGIFLL